MIRLNQSSLPDYLRHGRKRDACLSLIERDEITIPLTANRWDGGTREEYSLVNLATRRTERMLSAGETVSLVERAVIRAGTFCGKPSTPYITMRRNDCEARHASLLECNR